MSPASVTSVSSSRGASSFRGRRSTLSRRPADHAIAGADLEPRAAQRAEQLRRASCARRPAASARSSRCANGASELNDTSVIRPPPRSSVVSDLQHVVQLRGVEVDRRPTGCRAPVRRARSSRRRSCRAPRGAPAVWSRGRRGAAARGCGGRALGSRDLTSWRSRRRRRSGHIDASDTSRTADTACDGFGRERQPMSRRMTDGAPAVDRTGQRRGSDRNGVKHVRSAGGRTRRIGPARA